MKNGIKMWPVVLYAVFSVIYFGGQRIVRQQGMEYKNFVTILGFIIFAVWTVILIAGLFINSGYIVKKKKGLDRIPGGWIGSGIVVTIIVCLVMISIGIAGYKKLGQEIEKDGMIEVTHSTVLGDYKSFWKTVNYFMRRPVQPYEQEVYGLLEKKYGMEFHYVTDDEGVAYYTPQDYPDIMVTVYGMNPIEDDFCEQYSSLKLEQAWKNLNAEYTDDYINVELKKVDSAWQFILSLKDNSAEEEYCRLGAKLIYLAQTDSFFDQFPGTLYLEFFANNNLMRAQVKFGEGEDYTEQELCEKIRSELTSILYSTEHTDIIREYARQIYEKYFMGESGDTYEEGIDAKGNFFADIGRKYRLVFDRESANGRCLLFALNSIDGTQLKEYYAVDKETGTIIPSGKRSYTDSGSEEYYKATGEY